MVKNGQVVWNFFNPEITGNYYDGTMLPNGNLLLGHAHGVKIISPDKRIAWKIPGSRRLVQTNTLFFK